MTSHTFTTIHSQPGKKAEHHTVHIRPDGTIFSNKWTDSGKIFLCAGPISTEPEIQLPKHDGRIEDMVIVHVSGASGSGKTTLGQRITRELIRDRSDIQVIDTDELITEDTYGGKFLLWLKQDREVPVDYYTQAWKAIFLGCLRKAAFKAMVTGCKTLIFVGLLDHWAMDSDDPIKLDWVQYEYWLDTPPARILQRWYSRALQPFPESDDPMWSILVDGLPNERIWSSTEILEQSKRSRAIHLERGYTPLSEEDIFEKISLLAVD